MEGCCQISTSAMSAWGKPFGLPPNQNCFHDSVFWPCDPHPFHIQWVVFLPTGFPELVALERCGQKSSQLWWKIAGPGCPTMNVFRFQYFHAMKSENARVGQLFVQRIGVAAAEAAPVMEVMQTSLSWLRAWNKTKN